MKRITIKSDIPGMVAMASLELAVAVIPLCALTSQLLSSFAVTRDDPQAIWVEQFRPMRATLPL